MVYMVRFDYLYSIRLFDIWGYLIMNLYRTYHYFVDVFYYVFMNHVIRLVFKYLAVILSLVVVLYLSLYISAVLVAIAITSTISFELILLIMLLLGILSLCSLFYSLRR